ncbi:MAG: GTP-binding protein [Spirochaetes bacterium GWD1_27_9]|nr:MAG: GTP-binding protein [Spirochaetes bacterium GWB1_27_13]OHD24026.1 MAG: GTP-binding protein [Spirochaetes bacterium GWC1_27_15]OHD43952.1 MAG: GTP-binding protein [Spirochaetes bacterium GWD1_27_9]
MIKKKICMLGAFAVGKTSLVQRYVKSIFSDKYLTTVGVKIDKKTLEFNNQQIEMLLWDIYGEDEFQRVNTSYLRGTSGVLLVIDGTRKVTLDTAFILKQRTEEAIGKVPFVLVFNKVDLEKEWEIEESTIKNLSQEGFTIVKTSAKTGDGVEKAFLLLAEKLLEE